jgi:hypothetical protein
MCPRSNRRAVQTGLLVFMVRLSTLERSGMQHMVLIEALSPVLWSSERQRMPYWLLALKCGGRYM